MNIDIFWKILTSANVSLALVLIAVFLGLLTIKKFSK
ncbi:MAG: hypothetical protein ACD_12C00602G0003 [uncultured bacterium]|nr:MAG: hypothetical protein ACD_12C00602G0003 [uncultured bacterium]